MFKTQATAIRTNRGKEINEALERYRFVLFLILSIALVGAVGYGLVHRPPPLVLTVLPPQPTRLPAPTFTAHPVRFHIIGAVNSPGVYSLSPGALVQDAIQAAGGPSADADFETLNLATMIQDQQQIIVPSRSPALLPGSRTITLEESDNALININTADSRTLQTLPGIGPVLADRIIDYRTEHGPFNTADDLCAVKGIGETRLEQLRAFIIVGP